MATRKGSSRRGRNRAAAWLSLVFLALVLPSCGLYSTSPGTLPGHIKTLAVPAFDNKTTQVGLDEEITQAVIQRFVDDNHLKIVAESDANAVLTGSVIDYKNTVFGFTGREQAQEYRVQIAVAVRLSAASFDAWLGRRDPLPTSIYVSGGDEAAKAEVLGSLKERWAEERPEVAPVVLRAAETGVDRVLAEAQGASLFVPATFVIVLNVEEWTRSARTVEAAAEGAALVPPGN